MLVQLGSTKHERASGLDESRSPLASRPRLPAVGGAAPTWFPGISCRLERNRHRGRRLFLWIKGPGKVSDSRSCRSAVTQVEGQGRVVLPGWLSGWGRFAGSSRCCVARTTRSASVESGSSAGTRGRCRAVPSTRVDAAGVAPRRRRHRPAEPPRSRRSSRTLQFNPILIEATDPAEAMKPVRKRSR